MTPNEDGPSARRAPALDWPLVIISCDAFRDTWLPHLLLWDKFGGERRRVFLLTETMTFAERPDVAVVHPRPEQYAGPSDWIGMVRSGLEQIDAEHCLLVLDDFFLKASVDWRRIERYAAFALDRDCDTLTLGVHDTTRRGKATEIPDLLEVDPASPYWITTSPAIWKRASLLAILANRVGSAWDFEFTRRTDLPFSLKQYMVDRRTMALTPVWPYYAEYWAGVEATPLLSDSAIAKGKWQPGIPYFLAHNGIGGVRFWRRGFHSLPRPLVGGPIAKTWARVGMLFDLLLDVAFRPKVRGRAIATLSERARRLLRRRREQGQE
jgi:hypothetical protein